MTRLRAQSSQHADLRLYLITNDPDIAQYICQFDEVWPFVDLEYIGKSERQGHVDSWKSHYTLDDVTRVREAVPHSPMLVRINPLNEGSRHEIDEVVARGADSIMLPMFHDEDTLSRFHDLLRGRALSVPLFETVGALQCLPNALLSQPMDSLHIGLNDLSLELGYDFMFECMSRRILDDPAEALRSSGIRFGIGGIARIGSAGLPAEYIIGEHVRLGSSAAILSRSFHGAATTKEQLITNVDFATEVSRLREEYDRFGSAPVTELEINHQRLVEKTNEVSQAIANSRQNKHHRI